MSKDKFVGRWTLVSFEFPRSDDRIGDVMGKQTLGTLFYDASSSMSVQIMRADRQPFASGDQQKGTDQEVRAAVEGYIAYFGDYQVNEEEQAVIHRTKGSLFPNLVGQDQKRFYEFTGNCLTLTTPPVVVGGVTVTAVLIWEKSV